jgi:phosphate:Na+ symporter
MTFPLTLLDLAGAVALLLWGSHMVQTGVQRAFGPRLRDLLGRALRSRTRAFLAGLGVTTLLQSSTATGLMTAGLSASGAVELEPALAVMLGANVGTTLVAQAFSFDIAAMSPTLILVGVILFRRQGGATNRDVGRALIGLGLMFLALGELLEIMTHYEDSPNLRLIFGAVGTEPVVDVLLGAALTWAAHSSIASVLFIMSLAAKSVVPPDAAFALVIGANIGAAINPLVEGVSGDDPAARRLPLGNLFTRLLGGAVALALLAPLGRLMVTLQPDIARVVVDFHTLFNLAVAAVFFPALSLYAAALRRLLPRRADPSDPALPVYLDAASRESPALSLSAAARESLRLADLVADMIDAGKAGVRDSDRRLTADTRRRGAAVERLAGAIRAWLASLDNEDGGETDEPRVKAILTFVAQMEQASEVFCRTFLAQVSRHLKKTVCVPEPPRGEILAMLDRTAANLRAACALLMTEDARAAHLLLDEKALFRDHEARAEQAHFDALAARMPEGIGGEQEPTSALRLDLMRSLKQVNGHIIAAAYPILDRRGELLPTRRAANGA